MLTWAGTVRARGPRGARPPALPFFTPQLTRVAMALKRESGGAVARAAGRRAKVSGDPAGGHRGRSERPAGREPAPFGPSPFVPHHPALFPRGEGKNGYRAEKYEAPPVWAQSRKVVHTLAAVQSRRPCDQRADLTGAERMASERSEERLHRGRSCLEPLEDPGRGAGRSSPRCTCPGMGRPPRRRRERSGRSRKTARWPRQPAQGPRGERR